MLSQDQVDYYAKRAPEYENIYALPERQADLTIVKRWLRDHLAGETVLDVACGTGYFISSYVSGAKSVTAGDINPEMLAIAQAKPELQSVRFFQSDAYQLPEFEEAFSAGVSTFWWSHIPLERLPEFLQGFRARIKTRGKLLFIDNTFVPDSSRPINRRDETGNTYQKRVLSNGESFEVVKNYPTQESMAEVLNLPADQIAFQSLRYYWMAEIRL